MSTKSGNGRPGNTAKLAKRTDFLLSRMGYDAREATTFRVGASSFEAPMAGAKLAADGATALVMINASPYVKTPLAEESVHVHTVEAASTRYMADRFGFLSAKTVANIAEDCRNGIAFMTRHATGSDFGGPSENPYGRTFAGQFEQRPDIARALAQFYMLRSHNPNGSSAPSTDDLNRGLDGGTFFDFSIGLTRGALDRRICDVCDEEVYSLKCSHCPGTVYGMTDEEIAAQAARGIPDGRATFTFDDCHAGEISLVFNGAIPGASTAFSTARRQALAPNLAPNLATDSVDICSCCDEGSCDCASNDNGTCACHSDCQGCIDQSCGGMNAMASHQEEPMFTAELKASLGLAASATDAEVTAKINDNATKLAAANVENESLKLAQKTKDDADFATKWSEALGAETFAQIKDLPNREALATSLAARIGTAAKPVPPPIGDPLKGAGLAAAPNTEQPKPETEESRKFRTALGKFKTPEELAKFAQIGPIEAMEKWLATSGVTVTLTREPLHENFERQTKDNRRAMLGL